MHLAKVLPELHGLLRDSFYIDYILRYSARIGIGRGGGGGSCSD